MGTQGGPTRGDELRGAALALGQARTEHLAQEAAAVLDVAAVHVAQAWRHTRKWL